VDIRSTRKPLTLALCFYLVGCGSAGTKPDWEQDLLEESRPGEVLSSVFDNGEDYLVSAYDYGNLTLSRVTYDGTNNSPVALESSFSLDLVTSSPDLLISSSDRKSIGNLEDIESEVTALNKKGELVWQRTITSGMPIDVASGESAYVNMSLVYREAGENDDVDLLLTGLDNQGNVTWQNTVSESNTSVRDWVFTYGKKNQACYISKVDTAEFLTCLTPDGSERFVEPLGQSTYKGLYTFEENVVVTNSVGEKSIEIFDSEGFRYDPIPIDITIYDIVETPNGKVHVLGTSTTEQVVMTIDKGKVSTHEFQIAPWYGTTHSGFVVGLHNNSLTYDENSSVYLSSVLAEETKILDLDASKAQAVVIKITANDEVSTVVKGKSTTYHHRKDGECINRCFSIPEVQFLDGVVALDDGTLFVSWTDTKLTQICDLGYCGLVPLDPSKITLAKYSAQ